MSVDPSNFKTLFRTAYGDELGEVGSGVELKWSNLSVFAKKSKQRLLNNLSGSLKGGRLLAIMGSSGSGKTTLLNQFSGRNKDVVQDGFITFNGVSLGQEAISDISGYVLQDDLMFGKLTVEEVLLFGARMRMHPNAKPVDHARRVTKLLKVMELEGCRKVIIGSELEKGISGGQRKRLAVALELISRPSVLFLDEPTSGLDSVTALSLIHTLKGIAHKEKVTVVATIHQPSKRIFDLFDDLLMLDRGEAMYHGPSQDLDSFFSRAGFDCPETMNPTEFALSVLDNKEYREQISIRNSDPEMELERQMQNGVVVEMLANQPIFVNSDRVKISWFRQCSILLRRSITLELRSVNLLVVQIVQTIIMGVLIGTVFLLLPYSQAAITNRRAVLFFCSINQGYFGALLYINVLPAERLVIMRERLAGWYPASTYVIAKALTELIFQTIHPIVFSVLVYWLSGMVPTAGQFFIFVAFMALCMFAANSIAILISAATGRIILAAAALPLAMEVARLFGAYYVPPITLPLYFWWLQAISAVTYTYQGVVINQFQGLNFTGCNVTSSNITTTCYQTGDQVLASLGLDYMPVYACALCLILMILILRACAFLVLKVRP